MSTKPELEKENKELKSQIRELKKELKDLTENVVSEALESIGYGLVYTKEIGFALVSLNFDLEKRKAAVVDVVASKSKVEPMSVICKAKIVDELIRLDKERKAVLEQERLDRKRELARDEETE